MGRCDINRRGDGIQDFINQYELYEETPGDAASSVADASISDDLLDRMVALEGQRLELREHYERLDHRFEVVYDGMEAAMQRQYVADKFMQSQTA